MGETAREIEAHINRTREDLASNIRELDQKVRSAADWREHFNAHPGIALGMAFGGGLLLGSLVMGRSQNGTPEGGGGPVDLSHSNGVATRLAAGEPRPRSIHQQRAMETWDHVKGALLGLAAARVTEFIDELVPGFMEQFKREEGLGRQGS